ncbi:MAG: hypothetical protein GY729_05655 [Desulfobacteraceae bacterium]|nr:hypothetical protein [Desulfobacteraceae bacterium]
MSENNRQEWLPLLIGLIALFTVLVNPICARAFFKAVQPESPKKIQKVQSLKSGKHSAPEAVTKKEEKSLSPLFKTHQEQNPVLQVGISSPVKKASSRGSDLPLKTAMPLLMPNTAWKCEVSPGQSQDVLNIRVSWSTKETWLDALNEIGNQTGLQFIVDWNSNKVIVGDGNNTAESRQIQTRSFDKKMNKTKKPLPKETFISTITGDITISLARFMKSNGYHLKMQGPHGKRFELEYPIYLTGKSFKDNLYTINAALNQSQEYLFNFHVFQGNRIVMLDIQER